MIELHNIEKSFPLRGKVLDQLSFTAPAGRSIAIMGPSGSGKTTLLNIIGLLERPGSGTISFRGSDITTLTPDRAAAWRNANTGFIFQEHLLLPHLTIGENIRLPFLAGKISSQSLSSSEEHIAILAERTGIAQIMSKFPFQVSGGEAQRAAFVRALANRPALLLADEPTGSLDRANADTLAQLLAQLSRENGSTLIVVTHSERLAAAMDESYELTDGHLTAAKR
ncbi:MAG: ABC transporter ATP-binding protein [Bacteroidetes bacterium]|nr:ABC transporter ATP-binding protein [Bacteroidota bacterium]